MRNGDVFTGFRFDKVDCLLRSKNVCRCVAPAFENIGGNMTF